MNQEGENPASGSEAGQKLDLRYLVKALIKYNASDLHLKVGRPPLYRINGKLVSAKMVELSEIEIKSIILGILTPKQISILEEKKQIDLSTQLADLGRFRCNIYFQRNTISAVIRLVPFVIPDMESLGVPLVLKDLCRRQRGLILITGATGSGKSSTMASMLQHINETQQVHILSIEDPIEFIYRDLKASVTQREVGIDTLNMKEALIAGMRQDPDIITIGEMRDAETIQVALTAAETGHLVISTLHTNDVKSTIDRILDVFRSDAQNQIRVQLASSLIAIVSQQLVVRLDGSGRALACEVMIKSPAIENYILSNEIGRIAEAIANSSSYYKMQTMNQALEKLIGEGTISVEEAIKASESPGDLKMKLSGLDREEGYSPKE